MVKLWRLKHLNKHLWTALSSLITLVFISLLKQNQLLIQPLLRAGSEDRGNSRSRFMALPDAGRVGQSNDSVYWSEPSDLHIPAPWHNGGDINPERCRRSRRSAPTEPRQKNEKETAPQLPALRLNTAMTSWEADETLCKTGHHFFQTTVKADVSLLAPCH